MAERPPQEVDFYEIAPENWIGMGGVNNIHVNAVNHGYDARAFLAALPGGADSLRPYRRALCRGGEPIPAHLLACLTEPFFSTKSNGTGLGLAIVRRLVEQHGGEMRIHSDQATGPRFD